MTIPGVPYQNPLSYVGPQMNLVPIAMFYRPPTTTDKKYRVGSVVIIGKDPVSGTQGDLWYLSRFDSSGDAIWIQFAGGAGAPGIDFILTDEGAPPVEPTAGGVVSVLGGSGIVTSGSGGNVVTISDDGTYATTYTEDTGTAEPAANNLNILGDATQGSVTSGSGSTVTITNSSATESQIGVSALATDAESIAGTVDDETIVPTSLKAKLGDQTANAMTYGAGDNMALAWTDALTDGEVVIGSTAGSPAAANLISTDSSITITNGSNSIDIEVVNNSTQVFTPSIAGGTTPGTITYSVQGGRALRFGRIFVQSFTVSWTTIGGAAGDLIISGFPFTFGGGLTRGPFGSVWVEALTFPAGTTYANLRGIDATTTCVVSCYGSAITPLTLQIAANGTLHGTITWGMAT